MSQTSTSEAAEVSISVLAKEYASLEVEIDRLSREAPARDTLDAVDRKWDLEKRIRALAAQSAGDLMTQIKVMRAELVHGDLPQSIVELFLRSVESFAQGQIDVAAQSSRDL